MTIRFIRIWGAIFLLSPAILFAKGKISEDKAFNDVRREQRRIEAHTVKSAVASFDAKAGIAKNRSNGDEQRFRDLRGSYGKALEHFPNGFINQAAYKSLLKPLQTREPSDFDVIQLGIGILKQVNPQSSFAYSLAANDGWVPFMPPAPEFTSAEAAGEMVENYWTALVRDVPFNQFDVNPTVAQAIAELSALSDFHGPMINGQVTPQTFLRGNTEGDLVGPFVSQFLYQTVPWGTRMIGPEQRTPLPGLGNDFLTNFADWFTVINGGVTGQAIAFDPVLRIIRTPRDLAEYVHRDFPGQGGLEALLYLSSLGPNALDPSNPYRDNPTQVGFVTFGISYLLSLAQNAAEEAMKAAWFQKWQVHRRLRPEEFGFYLQQQLVNGMDLGIHPDLTTSQAAQQSFATYGSYFLSQAYPEAAPPHPSYPSGHAVFAGASATILKAYFNEDFVIPNPLQPDPTNTVLIPYPGILTVGGELNKFAFNVGLGRDFAGIHYRSDAYEGILLGEKVALEVLENESFLFNEDFPGYTLRKFDGTTIQIGGKRSP